MLNNVNAKENYIVVLVNNLPITKIDVIERAKLISYSIYQNVEFKNLNKFYDQLDPLFKITLKNMKALNITQIF